VAEAMQFDITARDQASEKLALVGRNVDKLADKIDELGRKDAKPKITLDSDRAKTKLDEFQRALREISNKRVRLDVDVQGRSEVGDLRRELSYMTDRTVKIRVDTADSNQRLRTLTERLRTISDTRAKVDITVTGEAKLDQVLGKLVAIQGMSPVRVRVEIGTGDSLYQLGEIERLLRRINGNTSTATVTVRQQFDRTLEGKILKLAGSLVNLKTAAALAANSSGTLVAGLFSLAGGLAQAGQAALIVPGAIAAIGGVVGTVKLGVQGLGDAFKALGKGDAEKLAEVMAKLSPNARALVTEVQRLGPAWKSTQLDVQQRLLAGLGTEAKQLGAAYLPSLRSGLGGVAVELNKGAVGLADFLESGAAVSRVDSIFRNTALAVGNIAPAATNVTAALLDIADVGASMLPELTDGAEGATQAFAQFIAEARQSGQLEQWIRGGIDRLEQLANVAGNAGGIIGGIYTAANAEGADFLTTLERGTQAVDDFVHSAEGQDTLRAFFQESRETVDALVPGLIAGKDAAVGFVQGFNDTNGMVRFGQAASTAAQSVEPLVSRLGTLAGGTLGLLADSASNAATALSPLISGLGWLVNLIGPVGPAVLGMVAAFAGMRLIAGYVTTASTAMAAGALNAGVYTERMLLASGASATFAAGAGTRVASTMGAVATGVGAAAKALPLLGVAVVALTAVYDEFGSTVDENANKVVRARSRSSRPSPPSRRRWSTARRSGSPPPSSRRRTRRPLTMCAGPSRTS
jgi:hypothetical protein